MGIVSLICLRIIAQRSKTAKDMSTKYRNNMIKHGFKRVQKWIFDLER